MKQVVRKSTIPLYAAAATWLLYALLFPLYRPLHYVLAAGAAAVIGIVARLLCPNTVEEVPEEPKSTGNAELDKMIDDGRKAIAEMKRLDDNIADPTISAQIVRLQELSGKIFAQVEQNPEKLPQIRRFMNYYLPTTLKILNAYDRMGEQGVAGENITSTMHKVESMMATIITAFEKLEEIGAYEICRPDIILYDVLGDVVCGGFAMPIRGGYARNVFIVTSGEMMALYAASNIASAVKNFGKRGYAQYSGVILNSRNIENEEALVKKALEEIGGEIVSVLPRSASVQEAEAEGKTVIEALPDSEMAGAYQKLAENILNLSAEVENNYE